ncbi:MAG: class I SAM-dependent methyltransferase [Candidatus Omnitrophica bacterium]|nr:class I SAM-dependent methyltransferase [Candidatus Omnitrophota bacterium]
MSILSRIYEKLRFLIARKGEKGEYSSGYLPSKVRDEFLSICKRKSGRILEIGCGEGLFIINLLKKAKGLKIFGVDILREGLLNAKEKLKAQDAKAVNLIESNGNELCFKDNTFDYVVCLNTLFNLPSFENVKGIIAESVRVAKKGAEIIVDIRNKNDLVTSLRYRFVKLYDSKCAVALRQYDPQEIIEIFEQNNAEVLEVLPIRAFFNLTVPITIIKAKKR